MLRTTQLLVKRQSQSLQLALWPAMQPLPSEQPPGPGRGGKGSRVFRVEVVAVGWFYLMAWEWGDIFPVPTLTPR